MKNSALSSMVVPVALLAGLICCAPAGAQPDPLNVAGALPKDELPFARVTLEEAQKMVVGPEISLQLREVTLREALQELQKQSGVALDFSWGGPQGELDDKKLSLDLKTRSFSAAFAAIMDEAGVKARLNRFGGRGAYNLGWNEMNAQPKAPRSGVGPFQIELEGVSSSFTKRVTLGADMKPSRTQNEDLSLQLKPVDDPDLKVVSAPIIQLTRATDDKGRSLLAKNGNLRMVRFGGSIRAYQPPLMLQLPGAGTQKIAQLEGTATYVLAAKNTAWEIPDIASKGAAHEFESQNQTIRLEIESAQIVGESVAVSLKASIVQADGIEIQADDRNIGERPQNPLLMTELLLGSLQLQDANGLLLSSSGYSSSGQGDGISIRTNFFPAGPRGVTTFVNGKLVRDTTPKPEITAPIRLLFNGPIEFVQTEVPFSFRDVPLP